MLDRRGFWKHSSGQEEDKKGGIVQEEGVKTELTKRGVKGTKDEKE